VVTRGSVVWVRGSSASRVGLVLWRRRGWCRVRVAGVGVLRVRVGRCVRCRLAWSGAVRAALVGPVAR